MFVTIVKQMEPEVRGYREDLSLGDFIEVLKREKVGLGIFKENHLSNPKFESAQSVGLDFDKGLTVKQFKKQMNIKFPEVFYILGKTKSDGIEKNGIVAERFRVIIKLNEAVTDYNKYRKIIRYFLNEFPEADTACSNPSRWFYPIKDIKVYGLSGKETKFFDVSNFEYTEDEKTNPVEDGTIEIASGLIDYYLSKPVTEGSRNSELFKIATLIHQGGGDILKTLEGSVFFASLKESGFEDHEIEGVINSVLNRPITFNADGLKVYTYAKVAKENRKIDWTVDDLLYKGGVSLLSAPPKQGKSWFVRQMCAEMLINNTFLNNKSHVNKILYIALDEPMQFVSATFRKVGLPVESELLLMDDLSSITDLDAVIKILKPDFIVIDTLFDFLKIDANSYGESKRIMKEIRKIAEAHNCHICLIHHTNKNVEMSTPLGSQGLIGGVDVLINFNRNRVTFKGRGVADVGFALRWDSDKWLYRINETSDPDDDF